MAGGRTLSRIVAGAGVALVLLLLTACAGANQSSEQGGETPSATNGSSSGQQDQTPGRQSLFTQFKAVGGGNHLSLEGLPDGSSCNVTARRQGPGGASLEITKDDSGFTLKRPQAGEPIYWTVTCTLRGETVTRTLRTTAESSGTQTESPAPSASPS